MTLDLTHSYDRRGRVTTRHYDKNRHMDSLTERVEDTPQIIDRTTQYGWCNCGLLESITDPLLHRTVFVYDVQSRLYEKFFGYATPKQTVVDFLYEGQTAPNTAGATSRLKSATDALQQVTNYSYFADDNVKQITYRTTSGQAISSTPDVTFTSDPYYNRMATMATGTDTTTYEYYPVTSAGTLGAGQLHTVDGPFDSDIITYAYDKLGRTTNQKINGVSNESTADYDALGRLTATSHSGFGFATRTYDGVTPRLQTVTVQNSEAPSLTTNYGYFGNSNDRRLQTVQNLDPNLANLSKFDYTYDSEGQIQTWAKQIGTGPALTGTYSADLVDQLKSAASATVPIPSPPPPATPPPPQTVTPPGNFNYEYDLAGNRKTDQQGTVMHSFDEVNEITDPGYTYDRNGNLTSDGVTSYEWDAANRLVAIQKTAPAPSPLPTPNPPPAVPPPQYPQPPQPPKVPNTTSLLTTRSEFSYDGLSRRIQIVEKQTTGNPAIDPNIWWIPVSKQYYLWSGNTIAEERDSTGANVTKRFFAEGEQINGINYYFTRDHLGSIREMVDFNGVVHAQYEYDPYGNRTKIRGDLECDFAFTGHWHHAPSGLNLALYRAYSPTLGRWLSRDPIGEEGGLNL